VDFACLDDKDVTRPGLELHAVDDPKATSLLNELDFIVGMGVKSGTRPGRATEQEYRGVHLIVIGAHEMV
jgi:hypothetical protein